MNHTEAIDLPVYTVRERPVVLDSDLARVYGVTTGNFNKAVMRNLNRFPEEFSFVLTDEEFRDLIFQIGRSKGRGGRRKPPRVFTHLFRCRPSTFSRFTKLTPLMTTAKVLLTGEWSLYALAETLMEAIRFDFDHSFGFYDNIKNPHRSRNFQNLKFEI